MSIESLDDVIDAVHKSTEDRSKLLKIKPKNMLIKPYQYDLCDARELLGDDDMDSTKQE